MQRQYEEGLITKVDYCINGDWNMRGCKINHALENNNVWHSQANSVSCSDSAIAPLVTSSARQLTGLTAALPSRSRSTDIRGNVAVHEALVDSALATSRQTLPYATNKPLSLSRYGVSLMDVSVSAVTNTVAYDPLGRQIAQTDGRGNTKHAEYNTLGQRSASIDALGNRTTYAYDQLGNLAAVTSPLGNSIVYEYDFRGRKAYEGGATYPARYTYDVFSNMITMMTYRNESLGHDSGDVTTWLYDEASGSMTNKVYADGKGPTYAYTPDGKLLRRIWARGVVTDYAYDRWNNLTNTTYSDETPAMSLFYDAMGRQVEAHNAAGMTTFTYDAFGSLTNENIIGVIDTNTIERYWDTYGRTVGYALNGERQTIIGYCIATGRLLTMHIGNMSGSQVLNDEPFTWSYLLGSDLKSTLVCPTDLTASWSYDANNQLLQVRNATSTNVISQYDYTYDAAGRRTACTKTGSAFAHGDEIVYAYNTRSELTNAVASVDADYRYAYQYDDIGNRIAASERGGESLYSANKLNRYIAIDEFIPVYDDDGNQTLIKTQSGIWNVIYNAENRPILWSNETTAVKMEYDYEGRRVFKEVLTAIATNCCSFLYDGQVLLATREGMNEADHILRPPSVDGYASPIFYISQSGERFLCAQDANRNITEEINVNGQLSCSYNYAPFGEVSVVGFDNGNRICWSGEYLDKELGCTYYLYRHYNSSIGRWCRLDPIGDIIPLSYYQFVENNPISLVDQNGLLSKSECDTYKDKAMKSDSYLKLAKYLDDHGCTNRVIECKCCGNGDAANHKKVGEVDYISICVDNSGLTEQTVMWLVDHETIHAMQDCDKKNPETCDVLLCRELEAYYHSKCKSGPPIQRKGCAIEAAKGSSNKLCNWKKRPINEFYRKAGEMFDKCVNAHKRFFEGD